MISSSTSGFVHSLTSALFPRTVLKYPPLARFPIRVSGEGVDCSHTPAALVLVQLSPPLSIFHFRYTATLRGRSVYRSSCLIGGDPFGSWYAAIISPTSWCGAATGLWSLLGVWRQRRSKAGGCFLTRTVHTDATRITLTQRRSSCCSRSCDSDFPAWDGSTPFAPACTLRYTFTSATAISSSLSRTSSSSNHSRFPTRIVASCSLKSLMLPLARVAQGHDGS